MTEEQKSKIITNVFSVFKKDIKDLGEWVDATIELDFLIKSIIKETIEQLEKGDNDGI